MAFLDVIMLELAVVLKVLFGEKIRGVGFLQKDVAIVFLVPQYAQYG